LDCIERSNCTHTPTHYRKKRYLAELVKFRLAAPGGALTRLRACLDDFAGANVDAAAALVESCGRFLIRLPGARAGALLPLLLLFVAFAVVFGCVRVDDCSSKHTVRHFPTSPRAQQT
jgi:hypothetical protein